MEPLAITVAEMANLLGVARQSIYDLVNQKSGISTAMAYKLAKATNTSVEYWVNLQKNYELWLYRDTDTSNIKKSHERDFYAIPSKLILTPKAINSVV